jgi:uncharacterized protein YqjF (DUF2071 family)
MSGVEHLEPLRRVGPVLERPVMEQRWEDVTFLHFRYAPEQVQRLLPAGVTVDVHDGSAWVALVPFRMEGLRLPGRRRLPFGSFPEVNVRTYVRAGRRRGVWFFSLDIDRLAPTVVARVAYHLPYCWGRVDHVRVGDLVTTRVERRWPSGGARSSTGSVVRTGSVVDPEDPTAQFLTARWGLVASARRGLRWAPVEHGEWPLHHGSVLHLDDGLIVAAGLPAPVGDPHVMWSPGVDVRVGLPVPA